MITDNYKYKFTLTLHDEKPNETFKSLGASDCVVEIESDSLEDKPSIKDVISIAKAYKCSDSLFVNLDIEDADGEYVDHEEFAVKIDYSNNTFEIFD